MSVLLVNGDALRIPLADGSVQMVITSPPYFNAREEYSSWDTYQEYLDDMAAVWRECWRVLCDGGRIAVNVPQGYGRPGARNGYQEYVTIGADTTYAIRNAGFTLRGHVVWNKKGMDAGTGWGTWKSAVCPVMVDVHEIIIIAHKGGRSRNPGTSTISTMDFLDSRESIWDIQPITGAHWHPAPFPPEIPRRLIELYTFAGDTVLDPFSGSGTTVKVAKELGRYGVGMDLSYAYLDRSRQDTYEYRLERWLNGKKDGASVDDLPLFSTREGSDD